MMYLYLIVATIIMSTIIITVSNILKTKPQESGIQVGSYFYYKGYPVRKCQEMTIDEDGNYVVDGKKFTVNQLENWYRKLTQ